METIVLGQPIRINIFIIATHPSLVATGAVVLQSDGNTIATQHLDKSGNTIFSIPSTSLGVGIHTLIAYYAGDKNFSRSVSLPIVKEIINK